jgi:hypothetical protein|tara:strand:- start:88 stop:225 length:138 start_codon:yes stop_codon:yes gene_type:complete
MEKWNRNDWQGRSRSQVENNTTISGIVVIAALVITIGLIVSSAIY